MSAKTKILVVDDDAGVRSFLVEVLSPSFEVVQASNGEEGVALIALEKPRLVLLDVSMPKMNGIDVLKKTHEQDPSMIFVMLTSQQDTELANRALTLGAREFITKPASADYIRTEITRLLAPAESTSARPWKVRP